MGKQIIFFLPGMFFYHGMRGRYPGVSITGAKCALKCDHCQAKTLEPMIYTELPEVLEEKCRYFHQNGSHGVLISGGCDDQGRLPWKPFISSIKKIKETTGLYISIHCGLVDEETAIMLKQAGVDQALIDVIGDDETYRAIYHVDFGVSRIYSSLEALNKAGLAVVPHVVCGLYYGKIKGEKKALKMITEFDIDQLVIVSLMAVKGTPVEGVKTPSAREVAEIIVEARELMPDTRISLGCARERGNEDLELLAIDAGVNRMALPSESAIEKAKGYGLEIRYQRTCCSVSADFSSDTW